MKFGTKWNNFNTRKSIRKCHLQNNSFLEWPMNEKFRWKSENTCDPQCTHLDRSSGQMGPLKNPKKTDDQFITLSFTFFIHLCNTYKTFVTFLEYYHETSNISHTLGIKIVGHSDVVGASPAGAAPTTSSFLDLIFGFSGLGKDNCGTKQATFKFWALVHLTLEVWRYMLTRSVPSYHHWFGYR